MTGVVLPEAFRTLADPLPVPLLLVTGAGVVEAANHAAVLELGSGPTPVAGSALTALVAEDPARVREYLRLCAGSRAPVVGSLSVRRTAGVAAYRADGFVARPRGLEGDALLVVALTPKDRAIARFMALNERIEELGREIGRRRRVEEEHRAVLAREQVARASAEESKQAMDRFLATVSHELRTPLTPILTWTRMLRTGKLEPGDVGRGLEAIERSAQAQTQLVDDLLDVSRIIAGKIRLDVRRVELGPVIAAAVESLRVAATARAIRVQTVIDPRAGLVLADPDRMQQVVWNLLSNAVKFTPKGGRVQVALRRVNSHLELVVSDTGAGIPAALVPVLFEPFRQGETAPGTRGGLGLGLAIVRHVVELHGGTVRCESAGEGQGATFVVSLPRSVLRLDPDVAEVQPVAREPVPFALEPVLQGVRLLLVDDERDTLDTLAMLFAASAADVRTADSTDRALAVLATWTPDVIVSDIGMPNGDGFELIRRVRALPVERGGRIPAVALTAYARVEDRMKALSAGFQMHVPKPVEPAELVTVIRSLLARTEAGPA